MNRLNLDRVGAILASRLPATVAASVVDYKLVSPSLARVIATFNTVDTTREILCEAVARALDHNATPVLGSWRRVNSYGNPAMVGFVAVNHETRPYTEADAKKMTALASNMLMDAQDDSLWEVRDDGAGGKLLCRQNDGGLRALMETAQVRQPRAPKLDSIMGAADRGDFVAFVDPVQETVRYGYVLATDLEIAPQPAGPLDLDPEDRFNAIEILPMDIIDTGPDNSSDETRGEGNRIAQRMIEDQFPVTVPCALVVESATMNGADRVAEVATPANPLNKQSLLDYYKRLYAAQGPDFYSKLAAIINSHSGF